MRTPIESNLPWLVFALPTVAGLLIFALGRTSRWLREGLALVGLGATSVVAIQVGFQVVHGRALRAWGMNFYADGLSAVMELLGAVMGFLVVIYSIRYLPHETSDERASPHRQAIYYGLVLLFFGAMNWTCATNNLLMLWIALEATTLTSAFLVTYYWRRQPLEAGYNYLVMVTVGMVFGLFGYVLIYTAVAPHLGARVGEAMLLTSLAKVLPMVPKHIALLSAACFMVGFGTKAGLVPFHTRLPDAHAEAPAPVSALLSGIVIKVGAYALARTITMFAPGFSAVVVFVAIACSVSMLIGMSMALVQDDLKRMLAFSSVAQIGFVVEGFALGTYLGIYGGVFHLINHTIIKALLFLSVGAVMYATGARKVSEVSGLSRTMPVTAFCFMVGAMAISGMPPFSGFWSKFTLFLAFGDVGLLWAAVIGVITGFMSLACFVLAGYRVFWGPYRAPASATTQAREVPASMWVCMAALAVYCLVIGVYPKLMHPLLDSATKGILSMLGR